jgi:hypothetical protein
MSAQAGVGQAFTLRQAQGALSEVEGQTCRAQFVFGGHVRFLSGFA